MMEGFYLIQATDKRLRHSTTPTSYFGQIKKGVREPLFLSLSNSSKLHAAISTVEIIVTGSLLLAVFAYSKKLINHIQQYSHLNLLKG
jgi:hypothetical protein